MEMRASRKSAFRNEHDDILRRISYVGMLVALGLVLQIVESSLPPLLPLPGAKLGLANLATLMALLILGPVEAFEVTVLRCLLGGLLRGSAIGLILSFSAGISATVVMCLFYLYFGSLFSITGVSIAGAAAHNTTQLAVAIPLVGFPGLINYLPYLLLVSIPTGLFIGLCARRLWSALQGLDQLPV